jgi:hypothetical protein
MRVHLSKRTALAAIIAILLLTVGVVHAAIGAEQPVSSSSTQAIEGVSHHWVYDAMGVAAYTEQSAAERAAKAAAQRSLGDLPAGLVRNADHGYSDAQLTVGLARLLKGTNPSVVGHELIVWIGDRAARVFVNQDGAIKLVESGTVRQLLPEGDSVAATDHGDKDAAEIASDALDVIKGLDPTLASQAGSAGSLVTAHGVGFVDKNGKHIVVRVDPDGNVSYPEW